MPITLNIHESGPMFCRGEPLIVVHDFLSSSSSWDAAAKEIACTSKVISVDLRNHGASPHSDEMSYQDMAGDLKQLMEAQGIEKTSFIGYGMGGKVAMMLAQMHPECISHLIVVDTTPFAYSYNYDKEISAMLRLDCSQVTNLDDADKILVDSIPDAERRQLLLKNLQLNDGQYEWCLNLKALQQSHSELSGFPPSDINAEDVSYPIMFLGGEKSENFQKEHIDAALARFPKAQLIVMPGKGDWLHAEKAEHFANLIADFVTRV